VPVWPSGLDDAGFVGEDDGLDAATGGACAILGTAYFPLYLFLVYGIGIGVWGRATGGRRMTAADPEPAHAL
jgi:hypothetical protein